jgi:hypothetical protein
LEKHISIGPRSLNIVILKRILVLNLAHLPVLTFCFPNPHWVSLTSIKWLILLFQHFGFLNCHSLQVNTNNTLNYFWLNFCQINFNFKIYSTAIQEQQSWAFGTNVTLLASGQNNVDIGSTGSGIYSPPPNKGGQNFVQYTQNNNYTTITSKIFKKGKFTVTYQFQLIIVLTYSLPYYISLDKF